MLGILDAGQTRLDREDVNARRHRERRHNPKAKKPPIADDERPSDRVLEAELHVPEALLRESGLSSERLDPRLVALERFALDANGLDACSDPSVAERLADLLLAGVAHRMEFLR